ncbi:MAG TPA: hypothetical protein VIV58_39080, partial [Kofleriaceae bacterium]
RAHRRRGSGHHRRRRMRGQQLIVALALAGCPHPNELARLQRDADVVGAINQPALDALVFRVELVKRELRGNLPGWETEWRIAELANDQLGLPPFAQLEPPGPAWRPVPTSLLGMRGYVQVRARQLADAHDGAALAFLVSDARARYARGTGEVGEHLGEIERWLRTSSSSRRSDSSRPGTSGSIRTSP